MNSKIEQVCQVVGILPKFTDIAENRSDKDNLAFWRQRYQMPSTFKTALLDSFNGAVNA